VRLFSNSILTFVTYTVTFPQFERNNTFGKLADISPRINFARLSKKVRSQEHLARGIRRLL